MGLTYSTEVAQRALELYSTGLSVKKVAKAMEPDPPSESWIYKIITAARVMRRPGRPKGSSKPSQWTVHEPEVEYFADILNRSDLAKILKLKAQWPYPSCVVEAIPSGRLCLETRAKVRVIEAMRPSRYLWDEVAPVIGFKTGRSACVWYGQVKYRTGAKRKPPKIKGAPRGIAQASQWEAPMAEAGTLIEVMSRKDLAKFAGLSRHESVYPLSVRSAIPAGRVSLYTRVRVRAIQAMRREDVPWKTIAIALGYKNANSVASVWHGYLSKHPSLSGAKE